MSSLSDNSSSRPTPVMTTSMTITVEPYERPFEDAAIWVSALIIFTCLVVGLVFNAVTVAVIIKYKKLRNLFVYIIFSMCVSDLLSAVISPLFWYRRTLGFDVWILPNFFCKFYWAADYMTTFGTAMHIVAFGVFRLISVRYPFFFKSIPSRIGIICCIVIWAISFGCGFVPPFIWFGAKERDRYSDSQDARWPACTLNMEWYDSYANFQKVGFPLFLYIPLVLVVIISCLTALQVHATMRSSVSSNNEVRKQKQAVLQLTLIVLSFLFGYIPFTAYEFWSLQERENTQQNRRIDYHFGLIEYFFIRLSECLNPVFYNLGSSKMRWHTKLYLRETCGIGKAVQERYSSEVTGDQSRSKSSEDKL